MCSLKLVFNEVMIRYIFTFNHYAYVVLFYCSQIILVSLYQSRRSSHFCSRKSQKSHLKPLFLEFKVIDVDIPKKLIASVYYDKRFYARPANSGKITSV